MCQRVQTQVGKGQWSDTFNLLVYFLNEHNAQLVKFGNAFGQHDHGEDATGDDSPVGVARLVTTTLTDASAFILSENNSMAHF